MAFPLLLGAERISKAAYSAWTLDEQLLVQRLTVLKLNPRFWENYRGMRAMGHRPMDSIVGAWLSTGAKGRGELRTLKALAESLGKSRKAIYRVADRMKSVAMGMAMSWLAARVPDVDEAVYSAAISMEGTSADRKLFYQRARVALSGEESEPVDNWLALLDQLKSGGAGEEERGSGGEEE